MAFKWYIAFRIGYCLVELNESPFIVFIIVPYLIEVKMVVIVAVLTWPTYSTAGQRQQRLQPAAGFVVVRSVYVASRVGD